VKREKIRLQLETNTNIHNIVTISMSHIKYQIRTMIQTWCC